MATLQEHFDRQKWLDTLQPGDPVGVFDLRGTRLVYTCTVTRRTPSGRIVTSNGEVFRADGYRHISRSSCYAERHLKPIDPPKQG